MGNKNTGKKYNEDFKKMVVDLYNSGNSAKDLSSEYGVSEVTIYTWIKKFSPMETEDGTSITSDEIAKMKKEMLRLQEENENLKKGYGHICEKVKTTELIKVIVDLQDQHDTQTLCGVLGIAKSTFYQSFKKTESNRERENKQLTKRIKEIYRESKMRYGAPKIHNLLEKEGYNVSVKRVQRLMKAAGLFSIVKKKFRPQSSKTKVMERENLLDQDFTTSTINEKWVADITYINTLRDGWCYLASVMDLHSKKIVGYSFGRKMTTDLVISALNNALDTQHTREGLILHSDLGSQYTSEDFQKLCETRKIKQSFSKKGCPYDNACIESFHAILKKEEVNHVTYLDYKTANLAIFQFIEGWYNRKRIHSGLDYKTPQDIEDQTKTA
ncbi:IS3 family transposase [Bacillus sp. FJAT-49736]|uniref:IS3 family transposase n=1 Tax=Bacillus sp. FJAT-49736 TaxID=2833582 RepID=UPI001BC95C70|nr:IS3 family transposase [Bacillus sp. FJAT-49736]MBS4172774.1 IS3 family transposase [Bacillus sp. FJAT-49736]MBS4172803.1 IS3 family transposase [Bacillus sp. FJAT-49736]MBS4173522.1 IS3 family transposase [Bacillus sp. FJAT-49736]MBS4174772.1 IS3 family transposase [Bacillus sp. FJAT-49736]MBS4174778.1 IS3 family transposase [Bacillus sp. FJAT-49736]